MFAICQIIIHKKLAGSLVLKLQLLAVRQSYPRPRSLHDVNMWPHVLLDRVVSLWGQRFVVTKLSSWLQS